MSNEHTSDSSTKTTAMQSPGEMLKAARELKQMSQPDVAKQLRLRVQWIVDIENNHFTDASALIYVRGYLRSYAKLVNLNPEVVLEVFDRLKFDEPFLNRKSQTATVEEPLPTSSSIMPFYKTKFRRDLNTKKLSLIGGIATGCLALVLALFWWRGEHAAHAAMVDTVEAEPAAVSPDDKATVATENRDGTELTLPKAETASAPAVMPAPASTTATTAVPAPVPPMAKPPLKHQASEENLPPVEELGGTDVSPSANRANDLTQLPDKVSR